MLRAGQAGEFDRIIVWKLDGFGRDRIESGYQLRALQQVGVKVDSATEPNDSPLLRNILMDFAEEESRRISQRVSANQRTRAQSGKRTNKAPFGYSNIAHPDGGVTLEPNQDAPVVTEAFQRYASGRFTLTDIREHIKEASTNPNRPQTRGGVHAMLRNPTYYGVNRHGKYAKSKIQVKSKAEKLADIVEVEGCHKQLIDRDTWQKVQERLENNQPSKSGRPHARFLFTGLVWCACGSRFCAFRRSAKNFNSYHCTRKNNAGDCDSKSISENRIKEVVIEPIKSLLGQLSREDMRKAVREELTRHQAAANTKATGSQEDLSKRQEKLETRLSRLEDSYLDGDIGKDRYLTRRDEILAQLAEIKEALAIQPKVVDADLDQLFAIADAITVETLDDQAWRDIIEGMVDRIIIEGTGDGRKSPPTIKVVWKPAYEPLFTLATES
jgi:hypothetical protein